MEVDGDYEDEPRVLRRMLGGADPALSGLFDRENLKRALCQMPAGYKQVLVLHDSSGMSTTKSLRFWIARRAIPSHSCIKPVCACVRFCKKSANGAARR